MSLLHLIEMDEDSFVSHEKEELPLNHQKLNNVVIFEDAAESQDPTLWCRTSSCEHVSDVTTVTKKSKMSNKVCSRHSQRQGSPILLESSQRGHKGESGRDFRDDTERAN